MLPGPRLPNASDEADAAAVAQRAARAYVAGEPISLAEVASTRSPQLARCTRAEVWRHGLQVYHGSADVRGVGDLAFVMTEITYQGEHILGADPYIVVLRRESRVWKAFSVTKDVETVKALPELCRRLNAGNHEGKVGSINMDWPNDGDIIPNLKGALRWTIADGGDEIVAEVCELMVDEWGRKDRGESWPIATLKLQTGEARSGSVPLEECALGMPVRWCVWAIGSRGTYGRLGCPTF